MDDYQKELQRIKNKVDFYEQEKNKVENVVYLMEEGSQYSESMVEVVREKEAQIHDLEKKCVELNMLTEVASQNSDEMRNLQNSIDVMKRQRTELKQMTGTISNISTYSDSNPPSHVDYNDEDRRTGEIQIDGPPNVERLYSEERELQPQRHYDRFNGKNNQTHKSPKMSKQFTPRRRNTSIGNYSQNIAQASIEGQHRPHDFNEKRRDPGDREEIRQLKDEIAELKQILLEKENQRTRMHFVPGEKNLAVHKDLQKVPSTLDIIQNDTTDLSALDEEFALNRQQNQQHKKVKPSLSSAEFDKVRRQIYETQNDYAEKRRSSNSNEQDESVVYDLSNKVRERRRARKSYTAEEEEISCEDVCAGPLYVVKIIRSLFGRRRDPIVRQW